MSHDASSEAQGSARSSWSSDSMSWWDDWPADFDGTGLFQSLEREDPPIFRFDVRNILEEVEEHLGSKVVDIPKVGKGSNYFGLHLRLASALDVLVRLARCDVNSSGTRTDNILDLVEQQASEVQFEAEIYKLLRPHRDILTSNLLYHRVPTYEEDAHHRMPSRDTHGRALFVFEKTAGVNNVWPDDAAKRLLLLEQCARIRAALFCFIIPHEFLTSWLARRPPCPKSIPVDIAPTRDFAIAFLVAKINEMIPDEGGTIGWEEDHSVVGPIASRAKKSLLQLMPLIMPENDQEVLYRLVLEHGDFGIHNMAITDTPTVTSLYDWETGHIVPAILSDPQMAIYVDLGIDGDGLPVISRMWEGITDEDRMDCLRCAEHYSQILAEQAPQYIQTIKAGKDVRHLWRALNSWRGDDPEQYFGTLGSWAELRLKEFGQVDSPGPEVI